MNYRYNQIHLPKRIPVVLLKDEVNRVLKQLTSTHWIMAILLYVSGLRREECITLRIKDIDVDVDSIEQ